MSCDLVGQDHLEKENRQIQISWVVETIVYFWLASHYTLSKTFKISAMLNKALNSGGKSWITNTNTAFKVKSEEQRLSQKELITNPTAIYCDDLKLPENIGHTNCDRSKIYI